MKKKQSFSELHLIKQRNKKWKIFKQILKITYDRCIRLCLWLKYELKKAMQTVK